MNTEGLRALSERLFDKAGPIYRRSTPELEAMIESTAVSIHAGTRSHGRSLDKIREDARGLVLELELASFRGMRRNPLKFDRTDPNSYAYDVFDSRTGIRIECKAAFKEKWMVWWPHAFETFLSNRQYVDAVVGGSVSFSNGWYETRIALVADAKSFHEYILDSKQTQGKKFYSHFTAERAGRAFIYKSDEDQKDQDGSC